jgi:cell division protein FtsZ
MGWGHSRHRRHLLFFDATTLDNDDIITKVEDSPTYLRDKQMLNKIKQSIVTDGSVNVPDAFEAPKETPDVITF